MRGETREQGTPVPEMGSWLGKSEKRIENRGWESGSAIAGSSHAPTSYVPGGGRKRRKTDRAGATRMVEASNAGRRTSERTKEGRGVE